MRAVKVARVWAVLWEWQDRHRYPHTQDCEEISAGS
jgi:hypothetical protein